MKLLQGGWRGATAFDFHWQMGNSVFIWKEMETIFFKNNEIFIRLFDGCRKGIIVGGDLLNKYKIILEGKKNEVK